MIDLARLSTQMAGYAPGDRASLTATLMDIVREIPRSADAWLCLSVVVDTPEQRRDCLERARRLDAHNPQVAVALEDVRTSEVQSMLNLLSGCRSIVDTPHEQERPIGVYLQDGGLAGPMIDKALALQRNTPVSARRPLLGEILIRQGWCTPQQVASLLIAQTNARRQANSSRRLRQIGEYLLECGDISIEQLHKALLIQLEDVARGKPSRLGEVIVRCGFVTPQRLTEALRIQETEYQNRFY